MQNRIITKETYEEHWNALSWEIEEALDLYFALIGWFDWQKERGASDEVYYTKFTRSVSVINNTFADHFLIKIVKIREKSRNKSSLYWLHQSALNLQLLKK